MHHPSLATGSTIAKCTNSFSIRKNNAFIMYVKCNETKMKVSCELYIEFISHIKYFDGNKATIP